MPTTVIKVKVAEAEKSDQAPYTFIIHTGSKFPSLDTTKKWKDGTMTLIINPGSDATESQPLKVKESFPMNTEGTVEVDYWLPKTIGVPKLLKVDLQESYKYGKKTALFVREITILYDRNPYRFPIKNYLYPHNPIRGNYTAAERGCPLHLLVREGAGTLRHQETEDFIIRARQEDLETIQSMVAWLEVEAGYLGLQEYDNLPRFLQYRQANLDAFRVRSKRGAEVIRSNAIENIKQKLRCSYKENRFGSFEDYKEFIKLEGDKMGWSKEVIFEAIKVAERFQDEEEFGRQMLCGPNALLIKKVKSLEGKWMDGADKVHCQILEGKSLSDTMGQERLFEVNCTNSLAGVPHGGAYSKQLTGTKQTWYVILSDCMLYQTDSGQLIPVLIRIENRNDGKAVTFWTPPELGTSQEDPKYLAWLLAKMYFRCANANVSALCTHFARGHAINEIFAVAAYRNMPNAHPMLRFLQPHIDGVIPVNVQARRILVNPGNNVFSAFLSAGDNLNLVLNTYYKQFSYQDLLVPDAIEKRGVKEIPEYFYRDDTLAHWQLIEEYTGQMIDLAYPSDEDVVNDVELQSFIKEVVQFGFQSQRGYENGAGFPTSILDKKKLTEYLTALIFNMSTFHTAVGSQAFTSYSFAPSVPTCMTMPPPKQDEEVTMDRILKTLPVAEIAFIAMNISFNTGHFLPTERFYLDDPAENKSGIIGYNMAVSPGQVACIRRLIEGMRGLKEKIDARNVGRHIKYDVLSPVNVPLTCQG